MSKSAIMNAKMLLAGTSGFAFKEWKGTLLPDQISPERRCCRIYATRFAHGRDQQHVLPDAQGVRAPQDWAKKVPHRGSCSPSRRASVSRTTPGSNPRVVPAPLDYLVKTTPRFSRTEGLTDACTQLPPNLKKDITIACGPSCRSFPRTAASPWSSVTRAGSGTTSSTALKDAGAALCLSEREDNAPPPLVETAPWGYVRLRLETYSDDELRQWAARLAGDGLERDLRLLHARADGARLRAAIDAVERGMKLAQVRKHALSLPEVAEQPHFDYASFRVRGKIFATVPPDEAHIHVFVGEDQREEALALHPAYVEKLTWGRKVVGLRVTLADAVPHAVLRLVSQAWRNKAPKTLVRQTEIP